jgi:hypothetical protein
VKTGGRLNKHARRTSLCLCEAEQIRCDDVETTLWSKTSLEHRASKPSDAGASLNQVLKWKFRLTSKSCCDSSLHHNRPKLSIASCVVVILAVAYAAFVILHLNERKNDFSAVYIWSSAARQGLNPYTDDLKKLERQLRLDDNSNQRANYPPPLIVAFEPITLLSPSTAYWVWQFVSIFAVTAALALLSGREMFLFAVFAVFYEPLTDHFLWAQSYTVVLLLLAISTSVRS